MTVINENKFMPNQPKTYEVRYVENQEPSKLVQLVSYLGVPRVYCNPDGDNNSSSTSGSNKNTSSGSSSSSSNGKKLGNDLEPKIVHVDTTDTNKRARDHARQQADDQWRKDVDETGCKVQ